MKKIFLIIQREYLTRVRKRSFLVMTVLGPLLMAATFVIPIYMATQSEETKKVAVLDETGYFFNKFSDTKSLHFHYYTVGDTNKRSASPKKSGDETIVMDCEDAKARFNKEGDDALLYIKEPENKTPPVNATLYSVKSADLNIVSYVKYIMVKRLEVIKLRGCLDKYKTDGHDSIPVNDILVSMRSTMDIETLKIDKNGKESKSYTELHMILGMFAGFMIYFFIFMFGAQVMRGVIEEKTSRIVEVIISSVKPFQLMMGKIIGVGLVGLTQFLLWVVLTFGIVTIATSTFIAKSGKQVTTEKIIQQQKSINPGGAELLQQQTEENPIADIDVWNAINSIDFFFMIRYFIFYFIFGFLFYAAFFAAIGSAVDSESDTQQFMLPITLPLVFAIVMAQYVIREPNGTWAFWLSVIPFTSPVIMMIRLSFNIGYDFWQVYLSMALLVLGFLANTWIAAKIYRTGILMYGKKINYVELWKWIRYK